MRRCYGAVKKTIPTELFRNSIALARTRTSVVKVSVSKSRDLFGLEAPGLFFGTFETVFTHY